MFSPLNTGGRLLVLACLLYTSTANAQEFSLLGGNRPVTAPRPPAVRAAQDEAVADDVPPQPAFILTNNGPVAGPPPQAPVLAVDDEYDVPNPEIQGADSPIPVGGLVNLSIKPWDERPEDLASVKYNWTVLPSKEVVTWPDGSRILFGTGNTATTYVVVMTASYVFTEKDPEGKITEIAQRTVTKIKAVQITGGTGTPPVNPGPGNGLTGLAKSAHDWVAMVNASPTYTAVAVKADAAKLAASFRSIADKIQNGQITDVSTILAQTKASNDAAIANRDAWLPWFTQMSQYLQQAYGNNTIKTMQQFEQAWRDIATGLDAASR